MVNEVMDFITGYDKEVPLFAAPITSTCSFILHYPQP